MKKYICNWATMKIKLLMRFAFAIAIMALLCSPGFSVEFIENTDAVIPGVYQCSISWGDYNNDGYLDLAVAGYTSTRIAKIYRNRGNNTFTDIGAGLSGVNNCSLSWGD